MRTLKPIGLAMAAVTAIATLAGLALVAPATAAPATPGFGPAIDNYATYDGQDTCDPTDKPGVVDFKNLLQRTYGSLPWNIGRACGGSQSEHKEGRALDYGFDITNPTQAANGTDLLNWLFATDQYGNRHAMVRRLGLMYIIWNRQIWGAYYNPPGWRAYSCNGTPSDCHTNHIHFSFSWAGALRQTTWWTSPTPGTGGGATAVTGDLGLVSNPSNLIAIHRRGTDNGVWGVSQTAAGGAYGSWIRIGAQIAASNPATLVATNGSIVAFARGTDNKIYGVSQLAPGGAYGSWILVGGNQPTFTGDPTAVTAANGSIVVYATATDGRVWGLSQLAPGGSYGNWAPIGTQTFASSPSALRASSGLLVVFARGADNKIYGVSQLAVGGAYGSWSQIGGAQSTYTGDPVTTLAANGSIVVYATGTDGRLWGLSQLGAGSSYGAWSPFASPTLGSNPAALRASNGVLAAFARGTDNKIYGVSQLAVGGAYGSWSQIGAGQPTFIGDPSAFVAPSTNGIVIVAVATDGAVWGVSQSGPNGSYSSWARLGS